MCADPYLNTDAGTMSPFEHGEVFVLDDGGEVRQPCCVSPLDLYFSVCRGFMFWICIYRCFIFVILLNYDFLKLLLRVLFCNFFNNTSRCFTHLLSSHLYFTFQCLTTDSYLFKAVTLISSWLNASYLRPVTFRLINIGDSNCSFWLWCYNSLTIEHVRKSQTASFSLIKIFFFFPREFYPIHISVYNILFVFWFEGWLGSWELWKILGH